MTLRVAIIGAGLSGLVTAKHCLEEGFVPTLFEGRKVYGGQWQYEEPDPITGEAQSSVYMGVTSNSCRDTSHFSDFPIDPSRYPDYYSHTLCARYIQEYVSHFGVEKYIRFNTRVESCHQLPDGQWKVTAGGVEETYDALFVCTGKNTYPNTPPFNGLENFAGQLVHSHVYRRPDPFFGKRVAIIGFGSSSVDIASEICSQAQSCHLVTRKGGWVMPRYMLGTPIEAWESRFDEYVLPTSLRSRIFEFLIRHFVGELPPELRAEHRLMEANAVIRSDFIENVNTGRITPHRASIEKFTETGLCLSNGDILEVDAVILCTGYRNKFPVVPDDSYRAATDPVNSLRLYRMTASPEYSNLFFMGILELVGPIHPTLELQARWATAVLAKRISLPSKEAMFTAIAKLSKEQSQHFTQAESHTTLVPMLPFCNSLATDLGIVPTFGRLLYRVFTSNPFTAFSILKYFYFGMITSAPYRLFGHGAKPEIATATILRMAKEEKSLSKAEKDALAADLLQRTNGKDED